METVGFSEALVPVYRTTLLHFAVYRSLYEVNAVFRFSIPGDSQTDSARAGRELLIHHNMKYCLENIGGGCENIWIHVETRYPFMEDTEW
jgi:hypothetical protein